MFVATIIETNVETQATDPETEEIFDADRKYFLSLRKKNFRKKRLIFYLRREAIRMLLWKTKLVSTESRVAVPRKISMTTNSILLPDDDEPALNKQKTKKKT
jgi:hypothetical protein